MNVILAESAGFCFGVNRAIDTVYKQIENNPNGNRIYTYGPIIHNTQVVGDLEQKGVNTIDGIDRLDSIKNQTLIIRSHGVSRDVYERAKENNITLVDATCPFVKKIHDIARRDSLEGRRIIIVGDSSHPEVVGIMGWVVNEPVTVKNEDEARKLSLPPKTPVTVVFQTTFNGNKFNNIVEIIQEKGYDTRVINTICNATSVRQKEAAQIAAQVDVMLVVGDRHSSNTQKLYEICKSYCVDTYYIQTIEDLNEHILQSGICVGITAGASTPNYIIQEVFLTCQKKKISTR